MSHQQMADLLFPDVTLIPADLFSMYPARDMPQEARVTRFAPSPTGALNIGGLYATLISERLAHQSNGVFYLRIEDTDKKREIPGGIENTLRSLVYFGVELDEGPSLSGQDVGCYGPYKQSLRDGIYRVFLKHLIRQGLAYPCFCNDEDVNQIRRSQQSSKVTPGYYGQWAKHRDITFQHAQEEVALGKPFVVRLRSSGYPDKKVIHHDLVKGRIEFPENDQDIVIMKTNGLPTYHFAHAIDDRLMGTTHVIRGDEWLSSLPIHIQLFEFLGFPLPKYGHIAPIMKLEGTSKRKFSKRKDLDGTAEYYKAKGYPGLALGEYFMNLINSGFEEWRAKNPEKAYHEYLISTDKMNSSGALLDMNKLNDISKEVISRLTSEDVYEYLYNWSKEYDSELFETIQKDKEYSLKILSIGRNSAKPRKDYAKWADIRPMIAFFYDGLFEEDAAGGYVIPNSISMEYAQTIIRRYGELFTLECDKEVWFSHIQSLAAELGYAKDMKQFKANPEQYKGHVGDIAMVIRVALTNRIQTPDLYDIMKVMGNERIRGRMRRFMAHMN